MTRLFADSDFLTGLRCKSDSRAGDASSLWTNMKKSGIVSGYGNLVVTDLVLVETFHLVQKKNGCDNAMTFFSELTGSCDVRMTTLDIMKRAIDEKLRLRGHRSKEPSIGLADAVSLIHMDDSGVRWIVSFDAGFDRYSLYRRIHDSESIGDLRASLRI